MDALHRRHRGATVKAGDGFRQPVDQGGIDFTTACLAVEQIVLCEAAHLEQVFEWWTIAADARRHRRAGQRQHFQIQPGRSGTIETQFFQTEMVTCLQRRKIEKTRCHRLLDFVGVVAGQQHPGDMGVDTFDCCHRMRITARIHQRLNEGRDSTVINHGHHAPLQMAQR